jgi:hypothetical protein
LKLKNMTLQKQRLEAINMLSAKVISWKDIPAPKSDIALDELIRYIYKLPPATLNELPYSFLTGTQTSSTNDSNSPLKRVLNRLDALDIKLKKPAERGYNCYVLGIEGIGLNWKSNADMIDEYNDLITTLDVTHEGKVSMSTCYRGTTEAGKYYTQNPLNKDGAAHVKIDFMHSDIWMLGKHNNQQNCLIQIGGAITITRDLNRDGTRAGDSGDMAGYYGINLHSAMDNVGSIGKFSAGCTVIPRVKEKDTLVNHFKKAVNKKVSYILLDGSKV